MVQDEINASQNAAADLRRKVDQNNSDVDARVASSGLEIDFAPEDDYLRLTIGEPKPSVSLRLQGLAAVYALVDPDSGQINAIEVPFFLEQVEKGSLSGELWGQVAAYIAEGRTTVYIPSRTKMETAGRELGALVRA